MLRIYKFYFFRHQIHPICFHIGYHHGLLCNFKFSRLAMRRFKFYSFRVQIYQICNPVGYPHRLLLKIRKSSFAKDFLYIFLISLNEITMTYSTGFISAELHNWFWHLPSLKFCLYCIIILSSIKWLLLWVRNHRWILKKFPPMEWYSFSLDWYFLWIPATLNGHFKIVPNIIITQDPIFDLSCVFVFSFCH